MNIIDWLGWSLNHLQIYNYILLDIQLIVYEVQYAIGYYQNRGLLVARPQRYEEFHSGTVRYGIFAKSRYTGIFRYGMCLIFSYQDLLGIFESFRFSLLVLLVINLESFHNCLGFCIYRSCPRKNFVITIKIIISGEKWNKCNQCWLCIFSGWQFEDTHAIQKSRKIPVFYFQKSRYRYLSPIPVYRYFPVYRRGLPRTPCQFLKQLGILILRHHPLLP